jgi:hypothetical protein
MFRAKLQPRNVGTPDGMWEMPKFVFTDEQR